jgi:glycosyltransferase involved in cell wall biosynthesis
MRSLPYTFRHRLIPATELKVADRQTFALGGTRMRSLSVVIPAFNEAENIEDVIASIPVSQLSDLGWSTEIVVVDNNSSDGTGELARACGARVVFQPEKGYGNAYRAGFGAAGGEIIASGDADRTYPFDHLPELLAELESSGADFLTTDRLHSANRGAMKHSHFWANHVLSFFSRLIFRHGIRDSQSGMWVFHRDVWAGVDVRSPGMAFSQEIKNAAVLAGYKVTETHIEYRVRGGDVKLNSVRDGLRNLAHLFGHRIRHDGPAPAGQKQAQDVPVRTRAEGVRFPAMRSASVAEAEGATPGCQTGSGTAA